VAQGILELSSRIISAAANLLIAPKCTYALEESFFFLAGETVSGSPVFDTLPADDYAEQQKFSPLHFRGKSLALA